jgi:hypothetical protein
VASSGKLLSIAVLYTFLNEETSVGIAAPYSA